MENPTLRILRERARLSQADAAERIHAKTVGKVRKDRRIIIEAEKQGTDSISLLEGMAAVYEAEFTVVLAANRHTQAVCQ